MTQQLTPEEIGLLIQARKLLNSKGIPRDIDVSSLCEQAGISRKTGYQWAEKLDQQKNREQQLEEELAGLRLAHEQLKQELDTVSFENRGRKLAWEIHRVDELIKKKSPISGQKRRKKQ